MSTSFVLRVSPLVFFLTLLSSYVYSAEKIEFPPVEVPQKKLFVGEKLVYRIRYLRIPVGRAEAEVKEIVQINNRPAYHIVVRVQSYPAINFIYPVRDEHHSFIDAENLYSLKYQKNIREGRHHAEEMMTYDQESHTAHIVNLETKSEKQIPIPENVQDQLSCGYFFRTLLIKPRSSVFIPVNADSKNWALEVKVHDVKSMKIKGIGRFHALEAEPLIQFRGIFVKQGKIRGWISLDERRIPLKMKVKVPILGSVVAELSEYHPGREEAGV